MNVSKAASSQLDLEGLVAQLHHQLAGQLECPEGEDLEEVCQMLYAASLLKEEGRAVRARIILVPPDGVDTSGGPPDSAHAVRFEVPLLLSAHELKRLSPAASFFHSALAVWPVKDKGFHIWGILNTGPRWLNLVAGGRKPMGNELPFPIIHVRDPGWLLFYHGYQLIAEWRGYEFHGPRLDVFQSRLLDDRFVHLRQRLIGESSGPQLPDHLSAEQYSSLAHLIAVQFIKRVINLVRSSGHGGSLLILPEGEEGMDAAARWVDCKYRSEMDEGGLRFRHLLQEILRRVGELSPPGSMAHDAWTVFRRSQDAELDHLEEAFFELARFYSDLMQVDGALVVDQKLQVIGFGGEIRVDRSVLQVLHALDLDGRRTTPWNVHGDGTRHRSVYRLCSVEPAVVGFVISQDSQVRMIANVNESVVFWNHSVV